MSVKKVGRPGQFTELSLGQVIRPALLGFLLVAGVFVIVGVLTSPWASAIPDDIRADAETGGVARGKYLAERAARRAAVDTAPNVAEQEIAAQLANGNADNAYRRAYRYAWNDAVNTLARRIPSQLLAREEHTQWIELLR